MTKIGIIDYGVGNIFSLKVALERASAKALVIQEPSRGLGVDGVVLPGVGSFQAATKFIERGRESIEEIYSSGTPILGICLGLQLFYAKSEEGEGRGLGFLKGEVLRLPRGVKVPHMGWNIVSIKDESELTSGLPKDFWAYFVHSYYPSPKEKASVKALTKYGLAFPSIVAKGSVFGTQFHPEKSAKAGAKIIENFVSLCRR